MDILERARQRKAEMEQHAAAAIEATETMKTIANLFSASIWAALPQKIKVYFEPYRDAE